MARSTPKQSGPSTRSLARESVARRRTMRVGTLNNCCASLHATRFVSSLCVTAIMRSQSSIPASTSTEGCPALPSTVRRSSRPGPRRESRFSRRESAQKRTHSIPNRGLCPKSDSVLFSPGEDAERLQLPLQMRALEAASLGDERNGSVRLREVMLEVVALESLARLSQRQIERQAHVRRTARELRHHPFGVARADLLLEAGERQGAHRGGEVLEVAGPGEIAQDVEGSGGEVSRRTKACFHQLRKHQARDFRDVLRMLAQGRKRDDDSGERLHQRRVEALRLHQAFRLLRREGHEPHVDLFRAGGEERQVLLLVL